VSTPLLQVEQALVCHGAVTAVDAVSLDVCAGEVFALVGPNGAGKSSLLGAIIGAVPLARGVVRFDNKVVNAMAPWQRARLGIGFCPEGRRVFAGLSVRENLIAGASGARIEIARRTDEIFTLFPPLRKRAEAPAWQLSGGQQQMLALGRALFRDPRLLLLDEPTLGLAPAIVHDVMDALGAVAAAGRAVLVADQNAVVLSRANRGLVLSGGRAVAQGSAVQLMTLPALTDAFLPG
jgi:branched-chain amino acid transport system ATP-binding protein